MLQSGECLRGNDLGYLRQSEDLDSYGSGDFVLFACIASCSGSAGGSIPIMRSYMQPCYSTEGPTQVYIYYSVYVYICNYTFLYMYIYVVYKYIYICIHHTASTCTYIYTRYTQRTSKSGVG